MEKVISDQLSVNNNPRSGAAAQAEERAEEAKEQENE
jgi:hypothetical protein